MADLISRQAVLNILKFNPIDDGGVVDDCIMQVLAFAKSKINKLPAVDAVEVVRCKDCRHWSNYTLSCDMLLSGGSTEHVNWYENDFCSYGERREENELVER